MSIGMSLGLHLGRGGAVGPRVVASDDFADTDATLIQNHVPSGGGTWTRHTASTGNATIRSNRLHGPSGSGQVVLPYHSWVPSSADYAVECDVILISDNDVSSAGPALRMDTSAATLYFARYADTVNAWQLFKTVAGTSTQLGSSVSATLTVGQAYRTRISAVGSTIALAVDGVPIVSVTDAAITAAGRAGMRLFDIAGAGVGVHLDNWAAVA